MSRRRTGIILALMIVVVMPLSLAAQEEKIEQVKAVDWSKLAEMLPDELAGMKADEVEGGSMSMADPMNPGQTFSYSSVERTYRSGDEDDAKEITVRILDSGYNKMLLMPYMMAMEFDGPDGGMKSVEIAGQPAKQITEKDDGKIVSVQYMILVGERLLVYLEGDENCSAEGLTKIAELLAFDKLAALVK